MPKEVPLFARQPIFDKSRNVIAYELLFRHSETNSAGVIDGDHATSTVLMSSFGEHQIDEFIGANRAFVNFTKNLLLHPPPIPKDKIVIEVLEDIEADEEVLQSVAKLKKQGFDIALDDFFINKDTKKLLIFSDIIKVDVLALSEAKLKKYVEVLKPLNKTLLAEKVEDHEMMQRCLDLGFDWFQGYFLCKPEIMKGVKVSEGKQAILRLIGTLNDANVQFDKVVETIASDPNLSYKILRLVNSSAVGLPREIESLSQAVAMLGLEAIRSWATFLLMANKDDKPQELCVISMCRAKFCEYIGASIAGKSFGESCFTAGLLSNLDAFLDMTMDLLVQKIKLSPDIEEALIHKRGKVGEVLNIVNHYERGEWMDIDWNLLAQHQIEPSTVNNYYGESVIWASQMVQEK